MKTIPAELEKPLRPGGVLEPARVGERLSLRMLGEAARLPKPVGDRAGVSSLSYTSSWLVI